MAARIIDRGRGPEVAGTRVTVYRIMDVLREGSSPGRIATELHLTEEQVRVALDYIAMHRRSVEAEYEKILQRVQQRNPPHVETGRAAIVPDARATPFPSAPLRSPIPLG